MARVTTTRKRKRPLTDNKRKNIMRWIAVVGASLVAIQALYISYTHIYAVVLGAGESEFAAILMPIGIDGLMIVAAIAIISGRKDAVTYGSFLFGVITSLGANILSASGSPVSYVIAALPPLALIGASEMLLRMTFPTRKRAIRQDTKNEITNTVRKTTRNTAQNVLSIAR